MGEAGEETASEREIPSGWRQQCSQGHRSGLARKCKLNNHGSTYISPDGAKFEDLESVYQSLYGAKGDIWKGNPVSLEEIDETEMQAEKRQRTGYSAQIIVTAATVRKPSVKQQVSTVRKYPAVKAVFKCGQCSYSFMSNDHLKTHMQNKHGKAQSNPTKTPQKLVSKWADIMNTALDRTVVNQPKVARSGSNQEEIIIDEIVPVKKPVNPTFVNVANQLDRRSTIKPLPKHSPSISIQPAKLTLTESQTILKTNSGLSIKLNQYPKSDFKVSQSPETSRLSSLSSISIVKSSPASMISPTVSVSKEKFSLKTAFDPKISEDFSFKDLKSNQTMMKKTVNVPGIVTIRSTPALPKPVPEQSKLVPEMPKPVPEKPKLVPEKPKPVPNNTNQSVNLEPESPAIILSSKDQEIAQQEMLFLATPVKCYFCELGRSRMSKSDPAEFFHLQLEMNGQLGKGNPSNRDVENLASYLRVNIGIARKVLQHIGVGNQTRESKNRLSFIRRMCWDNMESLRDLCNSFEQVWRTVNMIKDPFHISQEVLGQVYRWKFLFPQDPYYQTFLSQVFIHIHQGQDNVYNFMRNKVVDIEID